MTDLKRPEDCQTMAELRIQIDAIDKTLIALLAKRSGYIDRAVDLKKIEGLPARTTDRVAEVLGKVRALATDKALDPDLAEALWTELIEWGIQRELKELGH